MGRCLGKSAALYGDPVERVGRPGDKTDWPAGQNANKGNL